MKIFHHKQITYFQVTIFSIIAPSYCIKHVYCLTLASKMKLMVNLLLGSASCVEKGIVGGFEWNLTSVSNLLSYTDGHLWLLGFLCGPLFKSTN